jgi:hypothetical protein
MRSFVRRLNHRDAVMKHLDALLLLYPPKRQFARDFPMLKPTIRAHFEAGVPPPTSALQIAAMMIGNFVGQLEPADRAKVSAGLCEGGREAFAKAAQRRVGGERGKPRDNVVFVTELAGVAIYMAERMAEDGVLRWDEYADFLSRIEASLGVGPAERQQLAEVFAP